MAIRGTPAKGLGRDERCVGSNPTISVSVWLSMPRGEQQPLRLCVIGSSPMEAVGVWCNG